MSCEKHVTNDVGDVCRPCITVGSWAYTQLSAASIWCRTARWWWWWWWRRRHADKIGLRSNISGPNHAPDAVNKFKFHRTPGGRNPVSWFVMSRRVIINYYITQYIIQLRHEVDTNWRSKRPASFLLVSSCSGVCTRVLRRNKRLLCCTLPLWRRITRERSHS